MNNYAKKMYTTNEMKFVSFHFCGKIRMKNNEKETNEYLKKKLY